MSSVRIPSVQPVDPIPDPPPRRGPVPIGDDRLTDIISDMLGVRSLRDALRPSMVESDDEAALLSAWRALDADRQAEALRLLTAVQPSGEHVVTLYYIASNADEAVELVRDQAAVPTWHIRNRAHGRDDLEIGVDLMEDPGGLAGMPYVVGIALRLEPAALASYRLPGVEFTAYRIPFETVRRCRVSVFTRLPSNHVTRELLRSAAG